MAGIVYLILCWIAGSRIVKKHITGTKQSKEQKLNLIWVYLPAGFGAGILLCTWAVYLISWFASVKLGMQAPLILGNSIVGGAVLILETGLFFFRQKQKKQMVGQTLNRQNKWIGNRSLFQKELVFFLILGVFLTWIFFYVFHIRDGYLYSGFTVYGDYAPHTAMIRSFSMGNNFPTAYPHYGGQDVKYHFMFQFLVGNLEYLGLRMDFAYNLVSILALEGFFMLLYQLAKRITGRTAVGILTVVLFVFRSAFTFFRFLWEHLQAGDLLQTLSENTAFIGYTPNEDWGLWNFNVYLNQRHLAFGLLIAAFAVWIFMDWLDQADFQKEKGIAWMRNRLFTSNAWEWQHPGKAVLVGILLGLTSFWNGAAVIGGLLILLGFACFSDGKLDYALTALLAILLSMAQTKLFIDGSAFAVSFYWGFLAVDKSLTGVISYLFQMSGVFFTGLLLLVFFLKRKERLLLISFLFPAVFAFTISLTPDINVNHKYLMISYAFLAVFWANAILRLWKKRTAAKSAAILLTIALIATGVYDFVIILRNNGPGRRVCVDTASELTAWLVEHMEQEDLVLTAQYSMNEVTMSGAMLYSGWPYYAWSAGYDTNYRAAKAVEIYTSEDPEQVQKVLKEEEITYIIFEEGMEYEQQVCREDVIAQICTQVYNSKDGRIRIYETR